MKYKLLGLVLLCFFIACNKEDEDITEKKSKQYIDVTVTYDGTASCMPYETKGLSLSISALDGEGVMVSDFSVNISNLKSGKTFTMSYPVEAGTYEVSGFLDWDGLGGKNSYEPVVNYKRFDVDGYNRANVSVELIDRTEPSDSGWIKGYISYNGSYSGYHFIYIKIQDFEYNTIREDLVTPWLINLKDNKYKYTSGKIAAGDYFRVIAYWDINDSYSGGDYDVKGSSTGGIIKVSPGLPAVGIDIEVE